MICNYKKSNFKILLPLIIFSSIASSAEECYFVYPPWIHRPTHAENQNTIFDPTVPSKSLIKYSYNHYTYQNVKHHIYSIEKSEIQEEPKLESVKDWLESVALQLNEVHPNLKQELQEVLGSESAFKLWLIKRASRSEGRMILIKLYRVMCQFVPENYIIQKNEEQLNKKIEEMRVVTRWLSWIHLSDDMLSLVDIFMSPPDEFQIWLENAKEKHEDSKLLLIYNAMLTSYPPIGVNRIYVQAIKEAEQKIQPKTV